MNRAPIFVLALASAFSVTARARAQSTATADALYNRGLADMRAGRYETGCPAITESYKLDPQLGALFTLAECEAKRGRVATAVARYREYLELFARLPPAQRAQQAQLHRDRVSTQQAAALAAEVPELTLELPADAPAGTVVKHGDEVLGAAALGIALPVDPGDHVITTQAPNGPIKEHKVSVVRREKKKVALEVVRPAPPPPPPPPPPPSRALRVGAYAVGGVGLALLAAGAVTGGITLAKKGVINRECDISACSLEGEAVANSAKKIGVVSTIAFVAGAAGLGTGVVLFFADPARRAKSTSSATVPWARVGLVGAGAPLVGVEGSW
ncbi:Hypothetical protein A7982_03291 [Minicystis rosea]|nr:Hypothetical protein A7982_03291 [Minicystis rosea]